MGSLYWHILALAVWTQISGVFPKLCCRSCVEHCAGHDLLRGSGLTQKHVPVMSSEPFTCLKSLCAQTAAPKLRGQAGTCFTCAHMILKILSHGVLVTGAWFSMMQWCLWQVHPGYLSSVLKPAFGVPRLQQRMILREGMRGTGFKALNHTIFISLETKWKTQLHQKVYSAVFTVYIVN